MLSDKVKTENLLFRPVSDNRASLLRSAATVKRPVNERDVYLHLWKNYVAFACCVVPPSASPALRCASPDISLRWPLFSFLLSSSVSVGFCLPFSDFILGRFVTFRSRTLSAS